MAAGGTHYDEDLAYVQAAGFGGLAKTAISALVPRLRACGAEKVIDVGCGAGVTTRALVDEGFAPLAIEPSGALPAIARHAAPRAEFRHASVYEVSLEPCDAILAIGEPLTYHADETDAEERHQGFFREAHRVLRREGLLVFHVITAGEPPLDSRSRQSGEDWAVLSESREDPERRRLARTIETFRQVAGGTYQRGREVHAVRIFEEYALCAWLDAAGFDVETSTCYGSHPLAPRRKAFFAMRRSAPRPTKPAGERQR
jgi:SAM-dependent methyltransferase